MDSDLAGSILLGHLLAGCQILIPGPLGGQLAQTGSIPLIHVDSNIDRQAAGGECVDLVIVGVGIGAPLSDQIQVVSSQTVGQIHQQAVLPAVCSVGNAKAQDNIHQAAFHHSGIQADVAVAAVLVDFKVNGDIGIVLVELVDQSLGAVLTCESGVEGDLAGQLTCVLRNVNRISGHGGRCGGAAAVGSGSGVILLGFGGGATLRVVAGSKQRHDHHNCQQHCNKLFHVFSSIFYFYISGLGRKYIR